MQGWINCKHVITSNYDWPTFVFPCDMDDDADMDFVSAAYNANDVSCWENDGSENFTKQTITSNFSGAIPVTAFDLDGDTDIDVIAAAYNLSDVTWWENMGTGTEEGDTGYLPNDSVGATILTTMCHFNDLGPCKIFDVSGRTTTCANLCPGTYFIRTGDDTMYKVVLVE